jgi:hypothetical protein
LSKDSLREKNVTHITMAMGVTFITSDVEAKGEALEAEAPEAVVFWWKRKQKRLKMCRFRSVTKLVYKFWQIFDNSKLFLSDFVHVYLFHVQIIIFFLDNDVKYYIMNYIFTFQKEK